MLRASEERLPEGGPDTPMKKVNSSRSRLVGRVGEELEAGPPRRPCLV